MFSELINIATVFQAALMTWAAVVGGTFAAMFRLKRAPPTTHSLKPSKGMVP